MILLKNIMIFYSNVLNYIHIYYYFSYITNQIFFTYVLDMLLRMIPKKKTVFFIRSIYRILQILKIINVVTVLMLQNFSTYK